MKDITFAVIGSGFMGSTLAKTASEVPYAKCVAAADIILPRAQGLTDQLGGTAYEDFHELLEKENPQVVFIATPEIGPPSRSSVDSLAVFLGRRACTESGAGNS